MNPYLDECIKKLGPETEVLSHDDTSRKVKEISTKVVFGISGINWNEYPNYVPFNSRVIPQLTNKSCYVMWDEYTLPILKTNLESVIQNIDDVTILAFDTWIIGSELDWVLEFHHEGEVRFTLL